MLQENEKIIEKFRIDFSTEIHKAKTVLTTIKSSNFYLDFENETDRIDKYANEKITDEFSKLSMDLRSEERERLRQALVRINIQLRNEFRQSYIELSDVNSALY